MVYLLGVWAAAGQQGQSLFRASFLMEGKPHVGWHAGRRRAGWGIHRSNNLRLICTLLCVRGCAAAA
jgi:hypothetical protein